MLTTFYRAKKLVAKSGKYENLPHRSPCLCLAHLLNGLPDSPTQLLCLEPVFIKGPAGWHQRGPLGDRLPDHRASVLSLSVGLCWSNKKQLPVSPVVLYQIRTVFCRLQQCHMLVDRMEARNSVGTSPGDSPAIPKPKRRNPVTKDIVFL